MTTPPQFEWTEHPLIDTAEGGRWRKLSDAEVVSGLESGTPPETLEEYFKTREQRIADAERDPFRFEFPLPHWQDLEDMVRRKLVTFVPGGNNPGKSWWAASLAVRFLMRRFTWDNAPGDRLKVLMVCQDEQASRMIQQPHVYAHCPVEWRRVNELLKKPPGFIKRFNYGDKNGFTEDNFVLPGALKGQCWFKTAAQYTAKPSAFEGMVAHLIVIDEGCPVGLFKNLIGRARKENGRIIYLLTCLNGYDPTLGQGFEGAKITKTLPMQWDMLENRVNPDFTFPELRVGEHQTELLKRLGCPAGHLPYQMQPLQPHWGVQFMWNTFNPFQPPGLWKNSATSRKQQSHYWKAPAMPAMLDACVGQARWRAMVITFGWIERIGNLALGNFNPEVHVLRDEKREKLDAQIREGKATVYFADDPETQRSHAGLWLAVFENGTKYLFDETPRASEGDWVNLNSERGEGQYVYARQGANWYKHYLREREREWNLIECGERNAEWAAQSAASNAAQCHQVLKQRRGDPRGFATEESTATGTRSLFELFLEDHSAEHPDCYPMAFWPAKIRRSSLLDLDNLITLLKYDEDRALREGGLSAENTPKLFVSERCANFIRCALNYQLTPESKSSEDDPHRDFIDAARYLFAMDTPFIDPVRAADPGGGSWG